MAEALINVLLEQLVTVAFDHAKEAVQLILNAEAEVEKFGSNLRAIQAVLEDADKQQVEKATVRNWLEGLNDVSYEMVDVLDEWNTEILKQKAIGVPTEKRRTLKKVCVSIPLNCFCFAKVNKATHLYRVATEIKGLNEKLTLIAAQKEQFEFRQSSTRSTDEQLLKPVETSSFVNISKIFGREEATADLLSKLVSDSSEEEQEIPVIPLVGMGGMGKTTLAQLAYNNEKVKTYFEKRVWVCVSDPFDVVKVAKAIISGTGNRSPESTVLQEVLQSMSECFEDKRYLIVLDDVWTESQREWESLKLPTIMGSSKGSKIMVTTRKKKVVEIMGATTLMIHLDKLSDKNCLAVFNSIAYPGREEDEANGFGAIGEKIAKKCDGLPLAVRTLGSLLRFKKKPEEWQEVLDSKIWLLKEVEQQVFQPLLLSYYELTPTTRRCLLYCATFPKDYCFDKQVLIELWMSQDYLSGRDYKEKEKIGQIVFESLVMLSFFQDIGEVVNYWNSVVIISCKMHDIVHDFVQFLNKNECFTVELKEADGAIVMISEQVRHLTLMFKLFGSPLSDLISEVNCKKLRTLASFDSEMGSTDIKLISQVKCLRTLNLSGNHTEELPEDMGELIHLRYLDLSYNRFLKKLPDSLGNLYNLQTLRLSSCMYLRRLPENMGNLINLRHLRNNGCNSLEYLPRGMARLTSLQTLKQCTLSHDDNSVGLKLEDLGSLDQLQGSLTVKIQGVWNENATEEAQKARLCNKKLSDLLLDFTNLLRQSQQPLEALRPHQDLKYLYIDGYCGSTWPSWLESLQNLRSLILERCDGCKWLPSLGKLPCLEQLEFSGMEQVKRVGDEFLGTQTSSSSSFFPKLKKLTFRSMPEWEQWEGLVGGDDQVTIMPCLQNLLINNCPKLVGLPLFLQNTPLKKVSIRKCRRSIVIPVMPNNCDVEIEDELSEVTERDETETHIDEEVTMTHKVETDSQIDEQITMTHSVDTELQNDSQRDVLGVMPNAPWWRYLARHECMVLMVCAIMVIIYAIMVSS